MIESLLLVSPYIKNTLMPYCVRKQIKFYNYGTGRFGHPSQDRALTLREGAILQSFPDHSFLHST